MAVKETQKLWQRAFLIEVVNRQNPAQPEYAFTLTVPPDAFEYDLPQRVTRTKTFGGMFVDDYGIDNAKIRISGNTGGVSVRESYPNYQGTAGLDGRSSIFILRDQIAKYKEQTRSDYSQYVLKIYDLSSVATGLDSAFAAQQMLTDAWEVSLDEFKINRSKEKPLWYDFSIEFIVLRQLGSYYPQSSALDPFDGVGISDIVAAFEACQQLLADIQAGLITLQTDIDTAIFICDGIFRAYDDGIRQLNRFSEQLSSIDRLIRYPASLMQNILTRVQAAVDFVSSIPAKLGSELASVKDTYIKVSDQMNVLVQGSSLGVAYGKTINAVSIPIQIQTFEISTVQQAINGSAKSRMDQGSNSISPTSTQDASTAVVQTIIFGHKVVTATSATTFEKLSIENYGTANYASMIAAYNQIEDIDNISPGDIIKIPVLLSEPRLNDNQVFDADHIDAYGSDVKFSDTGGIVAGDDGDFATIGGNKNLFQAINFRLGELLGARVRLQTYGLLSQVGSSFTATAPISYLVSNILDTLAQEPRIKNITNLTLEGQGDSLKVSFDITGIDRQIVSFQGVI